MGRSVSIDNGQDVIDSRDVIKRIAELEDERDTHATCGLCHGGGTLDPIDGVGESRPCPDCDGTGAINISWAEDCDDDAAELKALTALAEEAEGYAADWSHGETLIRDSYFEDYARQTAEDIGAIDPNASWPLSCIDWAEAARQLQQDYTSVDFDGVTYWIR